MRSILLAGICVVGLTGCMTVTQPAAVRTSDGTLLFGTASASLVSNGSFTVSGSDGLSCAGTYDAFDPATTITVPLSCSDGRTGIATVTRTPDGQAGSGQVLLNDGMTAQVAFGALAGELIAPRPDVALDQTSEAEMLGLTGHNLPVNNATVTTGPPPTTTRRPAISQPTSGGFTPIRAAYTGRCDCPYDRMRNGRRCGGNSAYSRPGGRSPICYQ